MNHKFGYIFSFILGAVFSCSITYSVLSNSIKEERAEMVKLRKEIEKLNDGFNIPNPFAGFDKKFDSIKKQFEKEMAIDKKDQDKEDSFFGGIAKGLGSLTAGIAGGQITEREDEDFFYYDIEVGSSEKNEVNVKVENGHLLVDGMIVNEDNSGSVTSSYTSSFNQMQPLPRNVDQENFEMDHDKEKGILTIKFTKI